MLHDNISRQRTEGIIVSLLSTLAFCLATASCKSNWIRHNANHMWISEKQDIVCIEVAQSQILNVTKAVIAWDRAIQSWKRLIPKIGIDNTCDYTIQEVEHDPQQNNTFLAITSSIFGRKISLFKDRYEVDTLGITLHEIGHALGAVHKPNTLMASGIIYGKYSCPDADTITQVAIANGINPMLLTWCTK